MNIGYFLTHLLTHRETDPFKMGGACRRWFAGAQALFPSWRVCFLSMLQSSTSLSIWPCHIPDLCRVQLATEYFQQTAALKCLRNVLSSVLNSPAVFLACADWITLENAPRLTDCTEWPGVLYLISCTSLICTGKTRLGCSVGHKCFWLTSLCYALGVTWLVEMIFWC